MAYIHGAKMTLGSGVHSLNNGIPRNLEEGIPLQLRPGHTVRLEVAQELLTVHTGLSLVYAMAEALEVPLVDPNFSVEPYANRTLVESRDSTTFGCRLVVLEEKGTTNQRRVWVKKRSLDSFNL